MSAFNHLSSLDLQRIWDGVYGRMIHGQQITLGVIELDPNALRLVYIRSSNGKLVPLDAVTKPQLTVGPLSVTHLGQMPSVTISFNLLPGTSQRPA